jgi:hypothetical protein
VRIAESFGYMRRGKRDLRSVLQELPWGKFVLALWDWKGGIMGRILLIIAAITAVLVYWHFTNRQPLQAVTLKGNSNAPILLANSSSNVTVKNNSENPTYNVSGNSGIVTFGQTGSNMLIVNNPLTAPQITSTHLDFLCVTNSKDGINIAYKTQFSVEIHNPRKDMRLYFSKPYSTIGKPTMRSVNNGSIWGANSEMINFATAQITIWTSEKVSESDFGSFSIVP